MTDDRARTALKHLLRDYADAATEYDPTPPDSCPHGYGDPANCPKCIRNHVLPGRWAYFAELDHWLRVMRTCTCPGTRNHHPFKHRAKCTRPLHWHLNERYIRPHARTALKTWTGKHLPPHSERATHHLKVIARKDKTKLQAAPYAGTTIIARWHPAVHMTQVERALDWLLERMHQGDHTAINLPPDLRDATPEPAMTKREKIAA